MVQNFSIACLVLFLTILLTWDAKRPIFPSNHLIELIYGQRQPCFNDCLYFFQNSVPNMRKVSLKGWFSLKSYTKKTILWPIHPAFRKSLNSVNQLLTISRVQMKIPSLIFLQQSLLYTIPDCFPYNQFYF